MYKQVISCLLGICWAGALPLAAAGPTIPPVPKVSAMRAVSAGALRLPAWARVRATPVGGVRLPNRTFVAAQLPGAQLPAMQLPGASIKPNFISATALGVVRASSLQPVATPPFRPAGFTVRAPLAAPVTRQAWLAQTSQRATPVRFPQRERIDGVIFDMDGTLLDSIPMWDHVATRYFRSRGIELPEETQQYIRHISLLEGAQYIKEQFNLPDAPETLVEGTLSLVRQQYLYEVPAKPGVTELLQTLHAQGIKISVATASDKELAQRAFERLGLAPYIDFIISCDEVGVGKNFPDIYETALARLGTSKTRTLVVEDALYALQTAKTAGFLTAGVWEAFYPAEQEEQLRQTADYFFTSFENCLK